MKRNTHHREHEQPNLIGMHTSKDENKINKAEKDFHHISEVINQGMPVVMFDRVANDILSDKVIIDDNLAAFEAVQFLIDKGFKKIANLSKFSIPEKLQAKSWVSFIQKATLLTIGGKLNFNEHSAFSESSKAIKYQ